MFNVSVDRVGDISVVGCKGEITDGENAFHLMKTVFSQTSARAVVLDLTKLASIEGVAFGVFGFLQRWAESHQIQFKLFNPIYAVRNKLEYGKAAANRDIATVTEVMALVRSADGHYARAA